MNKLKIFYVWDEELIKQCDRLPAVEGRASLVHNLISVYGLLDHIKVVRSSPATYNDLREFHSELYLDHLKKIPEIDDDYIPDSQDDEYGIGYDCPPVSEMYKLVSIIAGGSITAAKSLILGMADVAVNWCGGWHHAQRFAADGFCYVNDIVIAIEKLRKKFSKVLYIDLDVHHGNGVQDAYNLSKSVFTLSFHKHEPGFYPGTGTLEDIGNLSGKGFSCNVPLKAGYSDSTLEYAFEKVFSLIYSRFSPDAIVVQCGADALAHDPRGGTGLTCRSYCKCVQSVLDKRKPTMLLGGGGYKHTNAARLWTTILALAAGVELDESIPEHDQWPYYGPYYSLSIEPALAKDVNTTEYLHWCIARIQSNLNYCNDNTEEECNYEPKPKRRKTEEMNCVMTLNSCCAGVTSSENKVIASMKNIKVDKLKTGTLSTNVGNIKKDNCLYSKCIETSPLPEAKDVYEFSD